MLHSSTTNKIKLVSPEIIRCPVCFNSVKHTGNVFVCINSDCNINYPIYSGIPLFINESASIFCFDDFLSGRSTFFKNRSKLVEWLNQKLPSISHNLAAKDNYKKLSNALTNKIKASRVLVIGGGIAGNGFEVIANNPSLELIETDVSLGPNLSVICDAHDLPFVDSCFDAVIVQAVLEHVIDPTRCVSEIHRVLNKDGIVYAETPFIQQVHGGKYDFMRFTHRGHRRLFNNFDEIDSGLTGGPGMALGWSWQYFLRSFGVSQQSQFILTLIARLTSFHLKYFDYLVRNKSTAYDSASGFYFMGRKNLHVISDKEIVHIYPYVS